MKIDVMPGRRFYILGPLMGGYGSKAFLAQELSPSGRLRPAVLIFLAEELVDDQRLFERIQKETNVAVRLDHINIITVLGLVKLEEGYARVVEFADGESLRSVLSRAQNLRRKIPPQVAAAVLADACAGIHHAHQAGREDAGKPLVHGAVRPGTVLVTFRGIGMVTGYGTAAIMEGMLEAQGPNVSISDPYSAPELIARGGEVASVATDVYALGAVLFEVLSGKPPEELPDVPQEGLVGVAQKAMAMEAGARFETAAGMREAIFQHTDVATKHEVGAFMQELFPNDLPQIQARRIMLKRGQLEFDTDPPALDSQGPPETVELVWRYPIQEVSLPTSQAEPASVDRPTKPPTAKPSSESEGVPEAAPQPKPEHRLPPPSVPERRRRVPPFVYLVLILMVAAAFFIGLMFSDWGKSDEPEREHIPVVLKPLHHEPAPKETKPAAGVSRPSSKSEGEPATAKKKPKRPAVRRSRRSQKGVGYLSVVAPEGSRVYIRGRYIGSAPLKMHKLPAGRHKVVVKSTTGQKYRRVVPIRPGQQMTLKVEFY